ncbi:MAG: SsrA-binding protein SmpB [candidate division Zixibacteria bacterium]|nr:SsrA-binding protein SmpB [candidate division Zixibacteria bacterium]
MNLKPTESQKEGEIRLVSRNRKALRDYEILETIEAGVSLMGSEVKSIRSGKLNISDSYAFPDNGELTLKNLHISAWESSGTESHEPLRPRRLLLHKKEIRKLTQMVAEKGLTIVTLAVYFRNGKVKVELGVGRGRKKHDKRQAIAERESERLIRRESKRDA